ncbi:DUF1501 domain-containing protein [Sphingorhabdus sp. Alg239-R122]|uniref:DUF1501 domain-containing protein n=1 Tax=Sphingorhabdus sp. Alg239-R122 TaxID=2305989 RepID=UPI0013D90A0F|nr:DUF1501 domain-containing protein [Sphingorhabdus sp. Alg239-R122]
MMDRRNLLAAMGLSTLGLAAPKMAFAQTGSRKKFILILQRGAADGLMALAPTGDRHFTSARTQFMRDIKDGHKIDSFFTLHAAMSNIARLYGERDALFAHAVASNYRERSHFDGQNILETGGNSPYAVKSGWMNRLVGLLPNAREQRAVALASALPQVLRGDNAAASFVPNNRRSPNAALLDRLSDLYSDEPLLSNAWEQARMTRDMVGETGRVGPRDMAAIGALMAKIVKGRDGASLAMYETSGWDTHAAQSFRTKTELGKLDSLIGALKAGLGADWSNTVILIATEFGRTVAMNGTQGTDHGTASLAYLIGGAVRGGRIVADWPGLAERQLYQKRDLMPTQSLEMLMAGTIGTHFGLDSAKVAAQLFPGAIQGRPLSGLVS